MPKKNQKRKKVQEEVNVPTPIIPDSKITKVDEKVIFMLRRQGPKLAKNTNPYQSHEFIIKSLIDKIITLSVRTSYTNQINNSMNDYFFEYIKNSVNPIFEENFIYHTTECHITKKDNKNLNKNLFWNKPNIEQNTWIEIIEPNSMKCDRCENIFININEYSTQFLLSNISKIEKKNINGLKRNLNKKAYSSRSMIHKKINNLPGFSYDNKLVNKINIAKKIFSRNNTSNFLVQEENSSQSSKEEEIKTKKVSYKLPKNNKHNDKSSLKKNQNSKKDQKNVNSFDKFERNKKNEKTLSPLNLPFFEIPNIENEYNFEKFDPPGIVSLRQEREEENKKKEKEIIKNNISNQVIQNVKATKEIKEKIIRKMKPFDPNKYSFDSNGKVISFKKINIDNFNKEFIYMKNVIKELNKPKTSNQNLKKIKNSKNNKNSNNSKKEDEILEMSPENIIHNPEDDPEGINKHNYVKLKEEKLNEKIIPSGSNFSIISPNIGVIIKENDKTKEGEKDFGKYFKKYSLNEYKKMLNEYVPLQNKTMLINKIGLPKLVKSSSLKSLTNSKILQTNNIIKNKNSNNINNNSAANADNSNPLIKEGNETVGEDLTFNYNYKNNYNTINNNHSSNRLFNSNSSYNNLYNSSSYNINLNRSNSFGMYNVIKINKVGLSSLKKEIDSMKDLSQNLNYNNYYSPGRTMIKSLNLFKKYKNNIKDINIVKIHKNKFNEFNSDILSSDGWGTAKEKRESSENTKFLYSKHRTRYQVLRELGSNILTGTKIKLPRDRKVEVNI